MTSRWLLAAPVLALSTLIAADQVSEKWTKRLDVAEAVYQTTVAKAENLKFNSVQKANSELLKTLKATLGDAVKANNFQAQAAIKERIEAAQSPGTKRPKPKNTITYAKHHYALVDGTATWHTAKTMCEEMGGHLVSLETKLEQDFVLGACRKANKPYWIGVSNETDVMQWAWVTGQAAVVEPSWKLDDPNPQHFSVGICYWPESSSFNDHNLGAHIGFVCEWEE